MAEYYVVKDKNTGLYFRGKGVNRWGKHYNQASIYRIKANAENTIKEVSWRGEQAEVVPIQIIENTADVAPKSEVENYKQVAEYQQKLAMDRYFEIKRLQEDVDRLQDINNRQVEDVRLAKQEVAREIFAEIEKAISKGFEYGTFFDAKRNIAKLKKKYTEGKT